MHPAFSVDSYPTSRPIFATNVNSPDDIERLFDTITYQKVSTKKYKKKQQQNQKHKSVE